MGPETGVWERLYINSGYLKYQGDVLVNVDSYSGLIEVFQSGNKTSETFKIFCSQISAILEKMVFKNCRQIVNGVN